MLEYSQHRKDYMALINRVGLGTSKEPFFWRPPPIIFIQLLLIIYFFVHSVKFTVAIDNNMQQFLHLSLIAIGLVEAQNDHSIKPNVPNHISNSSWFGGHFENLAVFGDNYTDESRLDYFTNHNNTPPPVGLLLPESLDASDGGRVWPRCMFRSFRLHY